MQTQELLPTAETTTPPQKKPTRPGKEGKWLQKGLKFVAKVGEEELKKLPGGSVFPALAELLSDVSTEENQWAAEERLQRILTASESSSATAEEIKQSVQLLGLITTLMYTQQEEMFAFLQASGDDIPDAEEIGAAAKTWALDLYQRSLACEFEKVDRRGVGESKQAQHMALLPLDAIYVEPNLITEVDLAHSREQDVSRRLDEEADYLAGDERRLLQDEQDRLLGERWRRLRERETKGTPLKQVLPTLQRAVLLGGPGSGKSTLVRYTARFCAGGGMGELTPIVVSLASYAGARQETVGLTLRQYIDRLMRERGDTVLEAAVGDALAHGAVFLLLDGVDEVPDATLRRNTVQAVEAFLEDHPKNRVLVTSRPIGYVQVSGGLLHYTLPPFTEEQVGSFIQQWHRAVAPVLQASEEQTASEADRMLAEIRANAQVAELATNPLMLVILTLLRSEGKKLPDRRVELYERVVKLLVDTWNELRRIDPTTKVQGSELNTEHFIKILAAVAHWVRTERTDRVIRRSVLESQFIRILDDEGDETPEATAKSYLDAASKRAGLLEECGHDYFVFWHPTFEEYLAARHFTRRPEQAKEKLWPYRHDPRFREIVLLAVGDLSLRLGEKVLATKLVLALANDTEEPLEALLHRGLCLAADAVADKVGVQAAALYTLFEKFVPVVLNQPFTPLFAAFKRITRAYPDILKQRPDFFPLVTELSESKSWQVRLEAARLAAHVSRELPEARALCIALQKDEDGGVQGFAAFGLALAGVQTEAVWIVLTYSNLMPDVQQDIQAALKLHNIYDDAIPTLLFFLLSENGYLRDSAARALVSAGRIGDAIPMLLSLLSSDGMVVRNFAAQTLVSAGYVDDALPTLLSVLSSEDATLRLSAAQAFVSAGRVDEAIPTLLSLLSDLHIPLYDSVAQTLVSAGHVDAAVPTLLSLLLSRDSYLRLFVAQALVSVGRVDEAIPTLLSLLSSENTDLRNFAAKTLRDVKPTRAMVASVISSLGGTAAAVEGYGVGILRNRSLTTEECAALQGLFTGDAAREAANQLLFDWLWDAQQKAPDPVAF